MKKQFSYLLAFFAAIMLSVGFVSCSSDDDDDDGGSSSKNPIIGTWVMQHQSDQDYDSYVFKKDGTGSMTIHRIMSGNNSTYPFTYTYGDNVLSIVYNDGDVEMWRVTLTGNTMTMTDGEYLYSYQKQ